jgi:hypothetical protein
MRKKRQVDLTVSSRRINHSNSKVTAGAGFAIPQVGDIIGKPEFFGFFCDLRSPQAIPCAYRRQNCSRDADVSHEC